MKRIATVLGTVVALAAVVLSGRPATGITFGELDTDNDFPNVGAVVVTGDFPDAPYTAGSCVLIHPRVVLTAGHVTIEGEQAIAEGVPLLDISAISFGTNALDPESWREIVAIKTHPDFSAHPHTPDIGVMILKEPVNISCAKLAYEGMLDDLHDAHLLNARKNPGRFVAVGYGNTLEFPPAREIPRDGLRRFVSPRYHNLSRSEIEFNQNPAAGLGGVAAGDSGGGLFWIAPNGERILVGIHRATDPNRLAHGMSSRTDLPWTLDFIDDVIEMVEAGVFD